MALQTQNMPIPLGGGLREDVDAFRQQAPNAQVLENATVRRGGAVAKAPGWQSIGTVPALATEGARALVASDDAMLLTSQDQCAILDTPAPGVAAEVRRIDEGFINPAGIDTIPVASPRGQVLDVGVTYHAAEDLYGVVWRELPDVANGTDDTELGGGDVVCQIQAPDGRVIAGPYRWTGTTVRGPGAERPLILPRIECCTDTSDRAVFFVLFAESNDATSGLIDGATGLFLYRARIPMQSIPTSAPSASAFTVGADLTRICYDTHSVSSHDAIYATTVLAGGDWYVYRLDGTTNVSTARLVGSDQNYTFPQVYHHAVTLTVVATEAGLGTVACLPEDASASTTATGLHTEDDPRLYEPATIGSTQLTYSGETMTIVGSAPGTITPPGTAALTVPRGWDPQPWIGNAAIFIAARQGVYCDPESSVLLDGVAYSISGKDLIGEFWPSTLEASLTHADGVWRESFPLLASKLPTLVYEGVYADPRTGETEVGHVPQTCVDADGRVVLGQAFSIASARAYLARPDVLTPVNQNDGGMPNQDRRVMLVRCSPLQADAVRSEVDQAGSRILAHGGVKVWDGANVFDFVPQPRISMYRQGTTAAASTGINMAAMAAVPESIAKNATGTLATAQAFFAMRAVLVYVDRNGTEWRSPPSPPVVVEDVVISTGLDLPRVEIDLDSWSAQRAVDGASFDVELYVTKRTEQSGSGFAFAVHNPGHTDAGQLSGTYYLAQRTPLLSDSNGFYVPDFLYVEQHGLLPRLATHVLYTSAGELAPYPPPASGVVARSGDYAFLVPSEFPYEFWASKPLEPGRGPEWAPELVYNVPTDSGGIVSLGAVGDRLFVLCRNGVYAMATANGPDATGAGAFGALQLVHRGDGCVNHMLTVSTPHGVFYASENGIRLAGVDGTVRDVGQPARDTIGDVSRFVRALYDRAEDEAIWFSRSVVIGTDPETEAPILAEAGVRLNLRTEAWSSFVRDGAMIDACRPARAERIYTLLEATNSILAEDPSVGTDNSGAMDLRYVSPWLTFDHALAYFRGRKIHALLRRTSGTGDIKVTLSYDYVDEVVDTFTFAFAELFDTTDTALVRVGQLTVRPSVQKFDAIRIGIRDAAYTEVVQGEEATIQSDLVWSLAGLEIEIAAKQGGIKLRAAQQNGSTGLGL